MFTSYIYRNKNKYDHCKLPPCPKHGIVYRKSNHCHIGWSFPIVNLDDEMQMYYSILLTDINECINGNHTCHQFATCKNIPGTFQCSCGPGYAGNGFTCDDINECAAATQGGCDVSRGRGQCINYPGGYNCSCISGYRLDPQGLLCDGNDFFYNIKV